MSVEGRVQEIQSHKFTRVHQNHKNGLFHGLTAPHLMGMSQYFYIPLQTSVFAASNGSSLMSIGGRVQEIRLDKLTHAHRNCKTWLNSPAYSSKSDGDVTRIFRKHRNRSLIWYKSGLDSTLRSCAMGA